MSKYEELKDVLVNEIYQKEPHDLLPSQRNLQKQYNVSSTTVQRALFDLEREGLIYFKHGKGIFVAPKIRYFPEVHFICDSIRTTGFGEEDMFPTIIEEIDNCLRINQMETIISFYKSTIDLENQLYESLSDKNPFGAILFCSCRKNVLEQFKLLCQRMNNIVLFDRYPRDINLNVNYVSTDLYNSAKELADKITNEFYEKIYLLFFADVFARGVFEIKAGFEEVLENKSQNYETYMVEKDVEGEEKYYEVIEKIGKDLENKKRVCLLSDTSIETFLIYNKYKRIFGKMEIVGVGSFCRPVEIKGKNIDAYWIKHDLKKLSEECVKLISENSKEKREVFVPGILINEKDYKSRKRNFEEVLNNFIKNSKNFKKK